MFNKLEKILMPMSDVLSKNRVLIAIRDGFLIATPLLIVGSIFLLIANFPIPGWSEFWTGVFGAGWEEWFKAVSRATFNCTALLTCLGTGYAMAREFGGNKIQGCLLYTSFQYLSVLILLISCINRGKLFRIQTVRFSAGAAHPGITVEISSFGQKFLTFLTIL